MKTIIKLLVDNNIASLFKQKTIFKMMSMTLLALTLSACGGGSDSAGPGEVLLTCDVPMVPDATGTSCVAPEPIQCEGITVPDALNEQCIVGVDPEAPAPVFFPSETQAVLYYNRADGKYDEYKIHNWNDPTCDAFADDSLAESWSNGLAHTGVDPVYGAYWVFNLKEDFGDCGNFILHKGTDDAGKEFGGGNWKMPLKQDDETYQRMNFTFSGFPSILEFPVVSLGEQPLAISGFSGHWIDVNTFVWNATDSEGNTPDFAKVMLHHSATAGIAADPENNDAINGSTVELIPADLTDAQKAAAPRVADWPAYTVNLSVDEAKNIVKNQLVLAGYDADNAPIAATYVQADLILDDLYTKGEDDANEATFGPVYDDAGISVAVWSPTAQSVKLKTFDASKTNTATHDMNLDPMTGIWSYQGDATLDRQFYRFELTLYHHQNKAIETIESTDPYSVSLSTNGMYSQFVNMSDDDLLPEGVTANDWAMQNVATINNYEDAVIYEGHIRDFSANDESTTKENRGKFLAFTETDSLPMQHLKKLADSGVTHFHMLPANDIATVDEDPEKIIDLDSTVLDLCKVDHTAPPCYQGNDSQTLRDLIASYDTYSEDAATLMNIVRNYDSFNWGYDPKHFNVPDGIYASDADGVARIKEMRAMIKSLHDTGLRVVLDVVYNHTNSAGLWDNSVLDKVVPGYYHSRDPKSGLVENSTCCSDTALTHVMMDKLMVDSLKHWTTHYQFDGFRFDIMSQGSKSQMLAARDAIQAIDPDNHFYGEGWYKASHGFERADQENMAGTEMATFNDRLRDGVRSAALFNNSAEGDALFQQDIVKFGMAGTLSDYVLKTSGGASTVGSSFGQKMYAKDPADIVNYISKHDNESLWDILQFNLDSNLTLDQRVRAQNVSHAVVIMSQGIPFLQMGGDFLRSKSLDRNTYDAGDWYNLVDFTFEDNNWNKGLPLDKGGRNQNDLVSLASSSSSKPYYNEISFASSVFNEFLSIRSNSPLFRLTTAEDIIARVGFHNIGKDQTQGLVVMSIDDGAGFADLDPAFDAIVVVVNGSENEISHAVNTASGFTLHPTLVNSVDGTVASASFAEDAETGTFTVPALTTAVFVKTQGESQGMGLSALATAGAPEVVPYGDTVVYVRGGMNGWGEVDAFEYVGEGIYQARITASAGDYDFKVASGDWSTVNNGAPSGDNAVVENTPKTLVPGSNDNLSISLAVDGTYLFTLNASNTDAPVLTVKNEEPYIGTNVYIRGDMNGWGEADQLVYLGRGLYQATITLTESTPNFKVASADWSTVNLGAPAGDNEITEGEVQSLLSGSNDNFTMTFAAGDYTFLLDASDASAPTLSIYAAKMFGETETYIRGGINGWGTDNPLVYQGNSTYSVEIAVEAGTHEFKAASSDWSTINLGAGDDTTTMLGKAYTLVPGSNNNLSMEFDESAVYVFTVSGPNPEQPTMTVTKK